METDKLKAFAVVAQTENLRRAAELLKITPSSLSKTIKQLEEELRTPLIAPLGRGIVLTQQGKELAKQARPIVESVDALRKRIHVAREEAKVAPLRIATFEVFSTYFLHALESVELGDRRMVLHEVTPGELEQAIEQGKADFGITYLPIPNPHLEHVKIASILMGVFKRKGAFKNLPQEELPFVIPAYPISGAPTRVKGLDGWPEDAYVRQVRYEVTLLESALELCRQGRCVGYFPSFVIEHHNRKYRDAYALERHPYGKALARCHSDVYVVKRKDRIEDADLRLVSKLIRLGTRLEATD